MRRLANNLPISQTLTAIVVVADEEFDGDELCLDEVRLVFGDSVIVLRPDPDTDEILVSQEELSKKFAGVTPAWAMGWVGQKLQTVWMCQNAQGYTDQLIFAFGNLHPSIAFVSEGATLKVFGFEQIHRPTLVSSNGAAVQASLDNPRHP